MATVNWGIGWVHPTAGSAGNNGYGPDTPKDTIQNGLSAGFKHLKIAAGTHTISAITDRCVLEFMPGTHTFTNAPVTSTRPVNLISSQRHPPALDGTGAAKITAPSAVNYFFDIAASVAANLYGMMVRGLWFDFAKLNSGGAAIRVAHMSQSVYEHCVGYEASYGGAYLIEEYMTGTGGGLDHSWNRFQNLVSWNGGIYSVPVPWFTSFNRGVFRDNTTVYPSGNGAHRPYSSYELRNQGVLFEGNTIDGVTADTAVFFDRGFDFVVIGNHTANLTQNLFFWADESGTNDWPMSSHFIHALGVNAQGGRIKLASSEFPTIGTESYEATRHIRTDLIAARNNL